MGALLRTPVLLFWPRELPAGEVICSTVIQGDPVAKQRPRVDQGRARTPEKTKEWEQAVGLQVLCDHPGIHACDFQHLGVRIAFYTKRGERRDLDNLVKCILDACNNVVWRDDVQVHEIHTRLIRGDANPRVELLVYTIEEPLALTFAA